MEISNGAIGNMESFRICSSYEADSETFDLSGVNTNKPIYAEGESVIAAADYDATTNTSLTARNGYLEGLHLGGTITYIVYAEQTADYLISASIAWISMAQTTDMLMTEDAPDWNPVMDTTVVTTVLMMPLTML